MDTSSEAFGILIIGICLLNQMCHMPRDMGEKCVPIWARLPPGHTSSRVGTSQRHTTGGLLHELSTRSVIRQLSRSSDG